MCVIIYKPEGAVVFLMYRVELKGLWRGTDTPLAGTFLMYRVELKA